MNDPKIEHHHIRETVNLPVGTLQITLMLEHHRGHRVAMQTGWKAELQVREVSDSVRNPLARLAIVSVNTAVPMATLRRWLTQFDDKTLPLLLCDLNTILVNRETSLDRPILRAMLRIDDKLAELGTIPDLPE